MPKLSKLFLPGLYYISAANAHSISVLYTESLYKNQSYMSAFLESFIPISFGQICDIPRNVEFSHLCKGNTNRPLKDIYEHLGALGHQASSFFMFYRNKYM